jgi:hypothetical protein
MYWCWEVFFFRGSQSGSVGNVLLTSCAVSVTVLFLYFVFYLGQIKE